jgi:hypothetical protein
MRSSILTASIVKLAALRDLIASESIRGASIGERGGWAASLVVRGAVFALPRADAPVGQTVPAGS